jgi:hypothetical protein
MSKVGRVGKEKAIFGRRGSTSPTGGGMSKVQSPKSKVGREGIGNLRFQDLKGAEGEIMNYEL